MKEQTIVNDLLHTYPHYLTVDPVEAGPCTQSVMPGDPSS
jgi:hypothetical protein